MEIILASGADDHMPAQTLKLYEAQGWVETLANLYDWYDEPRQLADLESLLDLAAALNNRADVAAALGRALLDTLITYSLDALPEGTRDLTVEQRVRALMAYHADRWTDKMGINVDIEGMALHFWVSFQAKVVNETLPDIETFRQWAIETAALHLFQRVKQNALKFAQCNLCGTPMECVGIQTILSDDGRWAVQTLRYKCANDHAVFIADDDTVAQAEQADTQLAGELAQEAGDIWGSEEVRSIPDDTDQECLNECGTILPYRGLCDRCRQEGYDFCAWESGCLAIIHRDPDNPDDGPWYCIHHEKLLSG